MFTEIRKRDGRVVPFNAEKITDAIIKAAKAVGGDNRKIAENLTAQVIKALRESGFNGMIPAVEDVQDMVEKAEKHPVCRDRRTRIRDGKAIDGYSERKLVKPAVRMQMFLTHPLKMLQLPVRPAAITHQLLPEEYSQAHLDGAFHIHDLDYYSKTLNCLQTCLNCFLQALTQVMAIRPLGS